MPSWRELQRKKFTPHARGSTPKKQREVKKNEVYPACAGIDPTTGKGFQGFFGLPRMRGDRPMRVSASSQRLLFTPHARGSTPRQIFPPLRFVVYPACAGIDLSARPLVPAQPGLPRMRGDRPTCWSVLRDQLRFTPHARGSTQDCPQHPIPPLVYPACAGIDRGSRSNQSRGSRLPRMRGDRPWLAQRGKGKRQFTPHARGSTHDHD